jgi:trehalose 6-phosphate synthase/phosphatase
VAEAIHEALTMPLEYKQVKHQHLYNHVTTYTAEHWAQSFITELQESLRLRGRGGTTPALNRTIISNAYATTKKRLLMFDYDGTLTAIRKTPNAAVPLPEMLEALTVLANDPNNAVWVVSGRDQQALENWLGSVPNLGLSAEHGCFLRYPGQEWINLLERDDLSWKKEVSEIFDYYTERTQGSFIEHKSSSITWHYRLADPAFGEFQAKECQNHLEDAVLSKLPVEILVGKKNLEVRPVNINKGGVVTRLIESTNYECDFIICAGDDKTDEDMFRAIRRHHSQLLDPSRAFCITIGGAKKKTTADWHVPSPEQLILILRQLVGLPAPAPGWYQTDDNAEEDDDNNGNNNDDDKETD